MVEKLINQIKFGIILIFVNCSVSGTYYFKGIEGTKKLYLHKDGSFKQIIYHNKLRDTFYGKWKKRKDTLVLKIIKPKIFYNNNNKSSTVTEKQLLETKKTIFEIEYDNGKKAIDAFVLVNDTIRINTNMEGKAIINGNININNFEVYSIGSLAYKSYKVKNIKSNLFSVKLHYVDIFSVDNYLRIEPDSSYLIKKKKIFFLSKLTKKQISKDYYLKKVKN